MKGQISVVIITFLFSLGGLAAAGQTAQENRAIPLPQATRSNAASAQRQADQPRVPVTKEAETFSPSQAPSQQLIVSPTLERSIVGLTDAVTQLVKKQDKEDSSSDWLGILTAVAGTIGAGLTLWGGILAYKKHSWLQEIRPFIPLFLIVGGLSIILVAALYLLSGLVTAVLYAFIAVIILMVALLITAAHLLTFIDNNRGLKRRMRKNFPELFGDSETLVTSSSSSDSL